MKPVLFVTGHAPAYRVGAFAALHEREGIELALFGGRSLHGGEEHGGELPFPHRYVRPHELYRLAASGAYRAVICPTGGRLAPLATWAGARRAGVPLVLWASLWAHPRSAAHALSYLPLSRLYRSADAIVTYGPHVSAYVTARGARNVHVAPQSVDNAFWGAVGVAPSAALSSDGARTSFLFVGRPSPEKGAELLLEAWRASGLAPPRARLVLVGGHDASAIAGARGTAPRLSGASKAGAGVASKEDDGDGGVVHLPALDRLALRAVYAACEVLVVPSVATATFREPWGLVVNEAMNRGLAVIASDAVGAAAGGLVRGGANGLVVAAGEPTALATALARLAQDGALASRMGSTGAADVAAFDHAAWAEGFSRALGTVNISRGHW